MTNFDIISAIPLFEELPQELQRDLASIINNLKFSRGDLIFSEGERAKGFYVVTQGRVKIFKLSMDGKEQILHIFGLGEPFGEVPVFSGGQYPAYAQALEKVNAVYFPRAALIDLIKRNPDLAMGLLAVLSRRLRRFSQLIEDLSLKEAPARLAAHLLYLSSLSGETPSLTLDVTKGQLASLLGTIPETLSRILGKLKAQKLIDIDGRRIEILDREGLEDLADAHTRLSELKSLKNPAV